MSGDVNKLVGREYDYIKGNTAIKPKRKSGIRRPDEKQKEIQRKKINRKKSILSKYRRQNDRKYMFTVVVAIFTLGCMTIAGDSNVYTMQSQTSKINSQIKQAQEENEALKVTLLKFSSLNNIEDKAKSKLSMHIPSKEQTVTIDFSKDYFESLEHEETTSNTEDKSLLTKLKKLIKF